MSADRIAALEARLAQLERCMVAAPIHFSPESSRRRRLRSSWLGLGIIGLAGIVAVQVATVRAQGEPQALTVKAPFQVVNARGEPLLIIDGRADTRLDILADNRVVARLSGSPNDAFLSLSGAQDSARIGVNFEGAGSGPSIRLKSGTSELLGVGSAGVSIKAPLTVSAGNAAVLDVKAQGITASGTVTVKNATGGEIARIAPEPSGGVAFSLGDRRSGGVNAGVGGSGNGYVVIAGQSGKPALNMGTPSGRPMGVYVLDPDGEKVQASLGLDNLNKGILRVGDPAGMRGVLGASKSGGISFGLFDGAGSDYRVGLLAAADNSFVRLNSQKNAVHLNADGTGGAVHIFNTLGNAAASLQSTTNGYGKLALGNADGDTLVEAGTTVDGLGVVRAGPTMGGPIAPEGVPFAIMGRTPRK